MFAIINYNNVQLKVKEGKEYDFPYFEAKDGDKITFDKILLISDDSGVKISDKELQGSKVEGVVTVPKINSEKVSVIKFHSKKRYQKIGNHRQDFTRVKINKING